jgi:hypothetical protein
MPAKTEAAPLTEHESSCFSSTVRTTTPSRRRSSRPSTRRKKNSGVTELVEMKGRGHALTIDSGWQEVAETALAFIKRFV